MYDEARQGHDLAHHAKLQVANVLLQEFAEFGLSVDNGYDPTVARSQFEHERAILSDSRLKWR